MSLHDTVYFIIIIIFFFQILAFSKPSSNQICVEISQLKDAERGPLNYLGGYILHNLYRNHLSKASKKTNICQGKKQFLLNSLHIDEPRYQRCSILLVPKIGEICGTAEIQFCVDTGKEVSHKICVDKIVDIFLRSKWNMLVEECGCEITKGRYTFFSYIRSYNCLSKDGSFLMKGHCSKIQNSAKGNQEERLEEGSQKGHESKYAGLMFHQFFSPSMYL